MVDLRPVAANCSSADFRICSRRRSRGSLTRLQGDGACRDPSYRYETSFPGNDTHTHLRHRNTAAGLWKRGSTLAGSAARANVVKARKLESEPKTHGWLGAVRSAIRAGQPRNVVRRRIVDQPSVLGPQEQAASEVVVGPPTVDECGPRLVVEAGYRSFGLNTIAPTPARPNADQPLERHAIDERARRLMR